VTLLFHVPRLKGVVVCTYVRPRPPLHRKDALPAGAGAPCGDRTGASAIEPVPLPIEPARCRSNRRRLRGSNRCRCRSNRRRLRGSNRRRLRGSNRRAADRTGVLL
jgi:hypothetical protein